MSQLIASISGIRGIVGDTLLPDTVISYVTAFARWCGRGPIVIGYDGRPSGLPIKDIARSVLQLSGIDVIDLGLVPTPSVQLKVEHSDAAGGIVITASHNPGQWNGLKFLNCQGIFLDAAENKEFFALRDQSESNYSASGELGQLIEDKGFIRDHIKVVLDYPGINVDRIRSRGFHVVCDAVNASGSDFLPALLEELGCSVDRLACDGSGIFPHTPEPLPENLTALGERVREVGADLGIAVDPDADRLVLYTEEGQPFGEEYSVTTAAYSVLSSAQKNETINIAVNLSTTRAVDDVAAGFGGIVHRSPVGEINVVGKMLETGAAIGGEGSGGVILPDIHAGRDSLVGTALVLDALAGFDGSASAFRASLPDYVIRKFKYSTADVDADTALAKVTEAFAGERINTDDGVRVDFEAGWVHLRKSNTESIVRVIAESHNAEEAEALATLVANVAFG